MNVHRRDAIHKQLDWFKQHFLSVFHSFHSLSKFSRYQSYVCIFGVRQKVISGSSSYLTGIVKASFCHFFDNSKSAAAQYYLREGKLVNVLFHTRTFSYRKMKKKRRRGKGEGKEKSRGGKRRGKREQ